MIPVLSVRCEMGHPKSHIQSVLKLGWKCRCPSTLLSSLAALPLNLDLSQRGGWEDGGVGGWGASRDSSTSCKFGAPAGLSFPTLLPPNLFLSLWKSREHGSPPPKGWEVGGREHPGTHQRSSYAGL